MKKVRKFPLIVVALIASIVLGFTIAACTDDVGEEIQWNYYVANVTPTAEGYSGALTVSGTEFTLKDASSYEMTAFNSGMEKVGDITDFTLSATGDPSVMELEFTDSRSLAQFDYWNISSKEPATSDGKYLEFDIYLAGTSFSMDCEQTYFDSFDDGVILDFSVNGATLKENLTVSDVTVSGALEGKAFAITRKSDTEFSLDFGYPFDDDSVDGAATVTLSADAIITAFPTDLYSYIKLDNILAEVDPNGIIADDNSATVPVKIRAGIFNDSFSAEGISFIGKNGEALTGVEIDSAQVSDGVLTLSLSGNAVNEKLNGADIVFSAAITSCGEQISLGVGNLSSILNYDVKAIKNDNAIVGYEAEFSLSNAVFDDLTANDISVAGEDSYEVKSVSAKGFTVSFNTSAELLDVTVEASSAKVVNNFGIDGAAGTEIVFSGKEADKISSIVVNTIVDIAKSIGNKVLNAAKDKVTATITPYILNFLGLGTEPSISLDDVSKQIEDLGVRLQNISSQINQTSKEIMALVELKSYQSTLESYNKSFNLLNLFNIQAYGDENGLAKVIAMEKEAEVNGTTESLKSNEEYQTALANFIEFFESMSPSFYSDIQTFGDDLIAASAGTNGGYLNAYFKCMDNFYIYNSQTIAPKENFLNNATTAYTLAMSAAIRVAESKNAALTSALTTSFKHTVDKIAEFGDKISALKNERNSGKVTDNIINKTVNLGVTNFTKGSDVYGASSMPGDGLTTGVYTEADIKALTEACAKRGKELITEMKAAGFTSLNADSSGKYRFVIGKSNEVRQLTSSSGVLFSTFKASSEKTAYAYSISRPYPVPIKNIYYYKAQQIVYDPSEKTYKSETVEYVLLYMNFSSNSCDRVYRNFERMLIVNS